MAFIFQLACFPLWFLLLMTPPAFAGNVLFVPLVGEGSHYNVMNCIASEMANRGHNITILVASHYKEKLSTLHGKERYHFESFTPVIPQEYFEESLRNMTNAGLNGKFFEWMLASLGSDFEKQQVLECRNILEDNDLMSTIRNAKFDLALFDTSYMCPVVQYLRKEVGIPFVAVSAVLNMFSGTWFANRWPFNPAYMPDFTSGFDHVMSFQERFTNTALTLFYFSFISLSATAYDELRRDFGIADTTPFYEDAELFLVNGHFALEFPKPSLPNTVMVGGLTTKPEKSLNTVRSFKSSNQNRNKKANSCILIV